MSGRIETMATLTAKTDEQLLEELIPEAERLINRHFGVQKEWFPHEYIPWDESSKLDENGNSEEAKELDDGTKSALFVNLLTEDNLPYYYYDIDRMFGKSEIWKYWTRRWTAEEGRHSIAIRDYITVKGLLDPKELERARMSQVEGGQTPHPPNVRDGFAYLAIQELATRISHHNTGKRLKDKKGQALMRRIAIDENLHYLFYRDMTTAALDENPSATVEAIDRQITGFQMPGAGIKDFVKHSRKIAKAGIYNFSLHSDSIVKPLVYGHWKIDKISGLSDAAKSAQEHLIKFTDKIGKIAQKLKAKSGESSEVSDTSEESEGD